MHGCALVAKQKESRIDLVGEREMYKEEGHVLEMRQTDECYVEEFTTLLIIDMTEETIAILGDRFPQKTRQEGDRVS